MTRKRMVAVILMVVLASFNWAGELKLEMKKEVVLGDGEVILDSIISVCQDNDGNIYTLDYKAGQVNKFSPEGKLLLKFGKKGEGPGEFKMPNEIQCTPGGKLVVTEQQKQVSLFDKDGKFLKRYNFNSATGIRYAAPGLYYMTRTNSSAISKQVLIDTKNEILNQDLFSIQHKPFMVDGVAIWYQSSQFSPNFLFSSHGGNSVIGISNQYKILVVNPKGQVIKTIERDVPKAKFTAGEKEFLSKEILQMKHWPAAAKKKLAGMVPDLKNYFQGIFLVKDRIWIIRLREDISEFQSALPVDVFNLKGKFLGNVSLKKMPRFISPGCIYFTGTNKTDDIILEKYSYKLIN